MSVVKPTYRHVPVSVGSSFDQTQSYKEGPNGKIEGDEWPVEIVEMDQDGKNQKTVKVGTWSINKYEPTKSGSKGGVEIIIDFTPTEALRTHAYQFNDEDDNDKLKYGMVGFLQACSATRQKKGVDENGEPHPVRALFTGKTTDDTEASQNHITSDHWWIDAGGNTNPMYGISDKQTQNPLWNQNERNIRKIDRESGSLTSGKESNGKYGYYLTDAKLKELQKDSKNRKKTTEMKWQPETIEQVKKAELSDSPERDFHVNEIRQHKFETALILMSNHKQQRGMVLGVLTWGYYMDGKDVQALPVKFKKNVSDTFQKACRAWDGKPIPNIHPAGIVQKNNGAQLNSFRLNSPYIRRSSPSHKKKSRTSPTQTNRMNNRRSQEPIYWC